MHYLYLLICSTILLASCIQCESEVKCTGPSIDIYFADFTKDEIDTVILNRYEPGGKFSTLVQGEVLDETKHTIIPVSYINGTPLHYSPHIIIATDPLYDWEIVVPSAGKSYRLSDIVLTGEPYKLDKHTCITEESSGCFRYMVGYKLNNETKLVEKKNKDSFKQPCLLKK